MLEIQKMTKHLTEDRINRAVYIAMTTGVGNEVYRVFDESRKSYSCLTDTGVIVVRNPQDVIITMYYASMAQAFAISKGQLSKALLEIIRRNHQKHYKRDQEKIKY